MPSVHVSIVKKSKSRKDTGVGQLMGSVWGALFGWLELCLKFDRRPAPPPAPRPAWHAAFGNVEKYVSPVLRQDRPQQAGHTLSFLQGPRETQPPHLADQCRALKSQFRSGTPGAAYYPVGLSQGMKNMIALCLFKRDRAGYC
jgi:hypothetical protein